jgi:prepilin-type N-terminal cleavage/methylation domain-containing protein
VTAPRSDAGFSLVELLLAVVLMATLASAAALASGENGEYRIGLMEVQLRDSVDYARYLARSTRTAHGVVFDVDAETFTLVDENGSPAVDPMTRGPYMVRLVAPNQPAGVRLDAVNFGAAGNCLLLDTDGYPLYGGTITLTCGSTSRTFTVNVVTGELLAP